MTSLPDLSKANRGMDVLIPNGPSPTFGREERVYLYVRICLQALKAD